MSWIRNTAWVLVILSPLRAGSARYGATTWRKSSNKSAGSRRNILTWPWTRNFQAWWRDPSANLNLPPIISTSSSGSLRWFSCDFFSLLHKIALSHILNLCRWSLVCALLQEIWICILMKVRYVFTIVTNLINVDRGFGNFALARGLLRDVVYLGWQ